MNKQTFQIPEGCKAVTVEQVGNQIITTFEPAFKRGDVIYCEDRDGFSWVFILKEKTNREYNPYDYFCGVTSTSGIIIDNSCRHPERVFRHATPEEAQRLLDALAKKGKRWNPETMQVEPIKKERWRAKVGQQYHYIMFPTLCIVCSEYSNSSEEVKMCSIGNHFQTKEQAQRSADKLKQALADFWKGELK